MCSQGWLHPWWLSRPSCCCQPWVTWPDPELTCFEGVGQEPPKVTSRLSDPVTPWHAQGAPCIHHSALMACHQSLTQLTSCMCAKPFPCRIYDPQEDPTGGGSSGWPHQQLPHVYTTCDLRGVTHRPILSASTNETPVFVDLQPFPVTKRSHWLDVLTYAAIPSAGHSY